MSRTRRRRIGWSLTIVSLLLAIAALASLPWVVAWDDPHHQRSVHLASGGFSFTSFRDPAAWPEPPFRASLSVSKHNWAFVKWFRYVEDPSIRHASFFAPLAFHPRHGHPRRMAPDGHAQACRLLWLPTRRPPPRLPLPRVRRSVTNASVPNTPIPTTSPLHFSTFSL